MGEEVKIQIVKQKKKDSEPDGVSVATKSLAPQMFSDQTFLVEGKIDERKAAVINELQSAALAYFAFRANTHKVRFFKHMIEWDLALSQGIGGLARRQAIQMVNAAAGGKNALDVAERPNVLARNISNRGWKEKATRDGKVIVE